MEKFIIPVFAVFGFLGSLFLGGPGDSLESNVTRTSKSQIEYD